MGQIHHLAPSADTHPCLSDVQCEYGFSLTTAAKINVQLTAG